MKLPHGREEKGRNVMKKIIVLLLSLALMLALAACGVKTPTTAGSKPTGSQPNVEIPTDPSDPTGGGQQSPTEPTKPNDGMVDPEDPSLSAYEKAFYQVFNSGRIVRFDMEDLAFDISFCETENFLLVVLHRMDHGSILPTEEGDIEGNFVSDIQLLYRSTFHTAEDGTITCKLQEHKLVMKRSGDYTDEVANKYLAYMAGKIGEETTQEEYDQMRDLLMGEAVEDTMFMDEEQYILVTAKREVDSYTDIRIDAYDGEKIECYFLVLEDMVQQVMEWGNASSTIAYSLTGKRLYEEDRNGEECRRMDYIYNDAGQLLRIEGSENGEKIATEEYTYDAAGNILRKMRYQKGILTGKIEYNAQGDIITNVEYDEEGNPYWGVETILDADGKPVEKIQYHGGKEKDVIRYDANGREISVTHYDYNGELHSTSEYTYDEAGNKVQEYTCYADGRSYLETYNSNGDLIKWVITEADERWEHTYDDRGNELSYYRYRQDVLVEWNVYTYNDANKMTSAVYYGENYNGEIGFDSKHLYFYDEKNLMIRMERYYEENGQVPDNVETYTYDANGNMLNSYTYEKDGSLRWWEEHSYDAAGRHLSHITYRGEGTSVVERREIWKYDAQGNCIENLVYGMDGEIAMGFSNEYDENGKLVGKTEYTESICRVTRYVDETYSTCHAYDRESNQLMYWVETFWEDGYIVEEIYHYQE